MKRLNLILTFILAFSLQCFSQTELYTLNFSGEKFSKDEISAKYEKFVAAFPEGYSMKPIIYHKVSDNDTILNYVAFGATKSSQKSTLKFEPEFVQDPFFLLLNKKMPEFSLPDIKGNIVLLANYFGKPMLINFWGTECGPCIAEMPDLNKLHEKYKDKINFLSIAGDSNSNGELDNFFREHTFNFKNLCSGYFYQKQIGITGIPKNVFIDKNGVIRYIQGNYPKKAQNEGVSLEDPDNYFVQIIDELIKEL
jgi:thiol-disulfide isomerase/thioredoxin